ncbi:hypothetical protein NC652_019433 [Populus alba x Populus x berolinensis]|nr:hypothetical protein NC652_019433 [Populus alba x Populus x berolinensis]
MELEDVHSDICSLRKLYGLLQGSPDGVQMAGFDLKFQSLDFVEHLLMHTEPHSLAHKGTA